jgi:hypothetical protein
LVETLCHRKPGYKEDKQRYEHVAIRTRLPALQRTS